MKDQNLLKITKKYCQEIPLRSWWELLFTIALIAFSVFLIIHISSSCMLLILSITQGLLLVRLFTIYHDYNHKSILSKSILADILMNIFGMICLCPKNLWNFYHDYHHKNNSKFSQIVFGSFPIITCEQFEALNRSQKKRYLIARHPVTILFSYVTIFMISFCIRPCIKNPKQHWSGVVAILCHFTCILLIGLASVKILLFVFIIPVFTMCLIAGYFFYVQHNFPSIKLYEDMKWNYVDASLFSSSYIQMNGIWKWISANIGYHHIHHLNSKIPFYNLPTVMKENIEFCQTESTTLKIKDIRACLLLKLWDSSSEGMVTLRYFKEKYKKLS